MQIDGVLYIPDFYKEKQQEEFKEVFARSLNLESFDKNDWEVDIATSKNVYSVSPLYNKAVGIWIVFNIPFQKIDLKLPSEINEKAEKLFKEEWFYGIKDKEAVNSLLAIVDNAFLE